MARSLVVVLDENADCFESIESVGVVLRSVVDEEIGKADQLVICELESASVLGPGEDSGDEIRSSGEFTIERKFGIVSIGLKEDKN